MSALVCPPPGLCCPLVATAVRVLQPPALYAGIAALHLPLGVSHHPHLMQHSHRPVSMLPDVCCLLMAIALMVAASSVFLLCCMSCCGPISQCALVHHHDCAGCRRPCLWPHLRPQAAGTTQPPARLLWVSCCLLSVLLFALHLRAALQIMMGESVGVKADIYSFGVTLHEIITGEPPQRGRLRQIW